MGANNYGTCPDGSGALGCGDQETYRQCSDITIGGGEGGRVVISDYNDGYGRGRDDFGGFYNEEPVEVGFPPEEGFHRGSRGWGK